MDIMAEATAAVSSSVPNQPMDEAFKYPFREFGKIKSEDHFKSSDMRVLVG